MRPTKPQRSSSSPNLGAYARRQASTESACLRRLSDRVNSVSKLQPSFLVIVFNHFHNITDLCASSVLVFFLEGDTSWKRHSLQFLSATAKTASMPGMS